MNINNLPGKDDVSFFQENGYWLSPKIFNDIELRDFREHHAKIVAGEYETKRPPLSRDPQPGDTSRLVQVNNAYWTDATIAKLTLHPLIGKIAARLSGVNGIRLWHDQLLFKPPQIGKAGNIGWHQDKGYWQCIDNDNAITAWVALEDVNEENGCMEVVPGSHRWGLLGEDHFYQQDVEEQIKRIEEKTGHRFTTTSCVLRAGCVSFHHCFTIHGSRANTSGRPRISLAIHLIADGTRYKAGTTSDDHTSNTLLRPKDGQPYAGPYFPVLFREDEPLANTWMTPSS
ncbi:MAG: phytanoyl-CoA dioxygenase family protein [Ignavibacteriales bacterium]|nr:phytanoyl-CoA dioxygenase family protein [Ignavibacteriales bacterium]